MEEKRLLYTIWLNQVCGHNSSTIYRLLSKYHTPEEAFSANHFDPDFYKTVRLSKVLTMDKTLESAKRLLEYCYNHNIQIFDREDGRYPEQLKHIDEPPTLLYAKGAIPDLNRMFGITIVGTRSGTAEGEKIAQMLARSLAESGVVIVSGMARGIDGAAHCGALECGGTTLAILAGGVDKIYPTEHTDLYHHILEHGGILSEQPPGVVGRPQFYQKRNRILAGLSYGTVIVEGELKSGTSLSARHAVNNNRDVFAVPGNPMHPTSALPNALIRDGAKQVVGPLDILEEYYELYAERLAYGMSLKKRPVTGRVQDLNHPPKEIVVPTIEPPKPSGETLLYQLEQELKNGTYKEEEVKILRYLCKRADSVSFDELAENCDLDIGTLNSMLIILQMKQKIQQAAGGQYRIQF